MKRNLIITTVLVALTLAAFTGGALAEEKGIDLKCLAATLAALTELVDAITDRVAALELQVGDSHIPETVHLGDDVCQNSLHTPYTEKIRREYSGNRQRLPHRLRRLYSPRPRRLSDWHCLCLRRQ